VRFITCPQLSILWTLRKPFIHPGFTSSPDSGRIGRRIIPAIAATLQLVEQIILAIPMRPLCGRGEDCKGLCAECGADLNLEACGCEDAVIDVRWAGLASLRTAAEGKE